MSDGVDLTGVPDADRLIYMQLNGESLINACGVNHYTTALCDEGFWARKVAGNFGDYARANNRQLYVELYRRGPRDALEWAIQHGYLGVVKRNVEYRMADLERALIVAVQFDHLDIVKYLVSKGANPRAQNDYALLYAAYKGRIAMVEYLVSQGADIHAGDGYDTQNSLWYAVEGGHLDVVKYLVSIGADVSAIRGDTLAAAIARGDVSVVEYLVERGANGDQALGIACQNGMLGVAKYLISHGANVDAADALRHAIINDRLEVLTYLVEEVGVDIHTRNDIAIVWAVNYAGDAVLDYILSRGMDINARDGEAVRIVVKSRSPEDLGRVLARGAAVKLETLLDASKRGGVSLFRQFVHYGVDIHVEDDAALREASVHGHIDLVKYLLSQGADIHARDDEALYFAAVNQHRRLFSYLISQGADPDAHGGEIRNQMRMLDWS